MPHATGFSSNTAIELVVFLALIAASALVSGSESAFFSLKNSQLIQLQEQEKPNSKLIIRMLEQPKRLLATILIVNTLISIAISIIAADITKSLLGGQPEYIQFLVEVIAVTFTLVLLGEITPKVYAAQHNVSFAGLMALPMKIMGQFFTPLSYLLIQSTYLLEKLVNNRGHNVKLDEIKQAIEMTASPHSTKEEKQILQGIVSFSNTNVRQAMTSRVDMMAVEYVITFTQLRAFINENRYSRIPVYEGDVDCIKGVLYIKDLVAHLNAGDDFEWQTIIRPPYFVPETKMIDDLLQEFQQRKIHLATVVDEYGGTSGIITMEDILEEIVGDIRDEFDDDEEIQYDKLSENVYVFNGKASLNDVERVLSLEDELEDIRGEAETLGGLVTELCKRIPRTGEVLVHERFVFEIESADKKRVRRVKITIQTAIKSRNSSEDEDE